MRLFSRKKKNDDDTNPSPSYTDEYNLGRSEHFLWRAEAGASSIQAVDWVSKTGVPYLEDVYALYKDEILKLGDANRLPINVIVKPSSACGGGIAGATGSGELSYCAGQWGSNQFCFGIIAHELCNLFTGERVSGGWPTAWWANHRSPFPTVIANEAMQRLVPRFYKMWGDYNDPLVVMFDRLYHDYRGMFPRMLQKMRELRVSLEGVGEPYLSHIIYYFMFYGAGRPVANYFVVPPMPAINPSWLGELEARYRLGIVV